MKASSVKWLLGMCVPVLIFGGVATYLSRAKPVALRDDGPFQLVIEGVRREKLTAANAQQGETAVFQVVLNARGEKPSWWGQPTQSSCGGEKKYENARIMATINGVEKTWNGQHTAFTAGWNAKTQRYEAQLSIKTQPPRDAALHWRGKVQLGECNDPALTELTAFDVELKAAGEQWPQEKFSRASEVAIRSVNIVRVDAKNYRTEITLFFPQDDTPRMGFSPDFVDAKGKHISLHDEKGYLTPLFHGSECCPPPINPATGAHSESNRLKEGILKWKTYDMQRAPRDVTAKIRVSSSDNWPLELLIPVKKNGQLLQGKVPIQTRPAPVQRD